jgi:ribosomal protein S18 acetylase RimI-like enzyme
MTAAEFDGYLAYAVDDYAAAHLRSGDCDPDEAKALAQKDYEALLPQGLATPGQHLFTLRSAQGSSVGILWFEARDRDGRRSAFIYDVRIEDGERGKGYGEATMRAFEELARSMGITRLSLNVMGYNMPARRLYEKCGYEITGMGMTKRL